MPISSSAHTALVPWLAGWRYSELDPDLRKSFEVALHAGTAAALLVHPPTERSCGKPVFLIAASTPPALVGYTLGARVERRLGTPRTIAAGLVAGSVAIAGGEMLAYRGCPERARSGAREHNLQAMDIADTRTPQARTGATGWRSAWPRHVRSSRASPAAAPPWRAHEHAASRAWTPTGSRGIPACP